MLRFSILTFVLLFLSLEAFPYTRSARRVISQSRAVSQKARGRMTIPRRRVERRSSQRTISRRNQRRAVVRSNRRVRRLRPGIRPVRRPRRLAATRGRSRAARSVARAGRSIVVENLKRRVPAHHQVQRLLGKSKSVLDRNATNLKRAFSPLRIR